MKKIFCPLLIVAVMISACNNNKPKEITVTDKDGKEKISIDPDKAKAGLEDLQKTKEELEKLIPLTNEEITALIPEELMGAARTKIDIDKGMGATVANADYKINDSADLRLEIVDCAGTGGAGLFGMQYMNMINVNSDDDEEYVKTIDLNGGKAFENCKKNRNRCTIAFFTGKRFLISLRGDNVGVDALKDIAGNLKLN